MVCIQPWGRRLPWELMWKKAGDRAGDWVQPSWRLGVRRGCPVFCSRGGRRGRVMPGQQ